VLRWLALGTVIGGFENVGVITFQKEMRFGLEFKLVFVRRITTFFVTVIAAWFLRSYWALVIGTLAGKVLGVGLTYLAHPMRPRFSTEKIGEIFSVSQWALVRGIGAYLDDNLHRMLVGRRASASTLGAYTLADEITAMPSSELLAPLNRVLFPGFVRVRDDPRELKRLFLLAQGLQTLVGVPAALGLALVAHEAVLLLLGERWIAAVPFVQLLALAAVLQPISASAGYVMITLGANRLSAVAVWGRLLAFVVAAFLLMPNAGPQEIAWLRGLSMIVSLLLSLWLLVCTFPAVRARDMVVTVIRPLVAAAVMAAAVMGAGAYLAFDPAVALVLKVLVGGVVYSTVLGALWLLADKPAGAESYLYDLVVSRLRSRGVLRR